MRASGCVPAGTNLICRKALEELLRGKAAKLVLAAYEEQLLDWRGFVHARQIASTQRLQRSDGLGLIRLA